MNKIVIHNKLNIHTACVIIKPISKAQCIRKYQELFKHYNFLSKQILYGNRLTLKPSVLKRESNKH